MRIEIKISDLVEHYRQHSSEIFICYHISEITNLTAPFDLYTIEVAVKRFFARYFQLVDRSCSTITYWFCQYEDGENLWKPESCYVMTNTGKKLIHQIEDVEHSEYNGRTLRIMLMEYILRIDPEAVFSFETSEGSLEF